MAKNIDALKQEIAELKQKFADYILTTDARITALESSSTSSKKEKKAKAEKPEKAKAEKAEKAKTNCPKISKKLTEELEKILGTRYPEENKERAEMNKKFRDFANAIPEEEYKTMEMSVIVTNFVAELSKHDPKGDDTEEETLTGGGAVKTMSLTDLVDVQDEVTKTSDVGIYLLDGNRITGPLRDEEKEDLVTKTFNGKEYDVDEATGRVYDTDTEEFLGYSRIKNKKFDGLIGKKA